jgi:hypothetical protein
MIDDRMSNQDFATMSDPQTVTSSTRGNTLPGTQQVTMNVTHQGTSFLKGITSGGA